jgi:hypothetical protein
MRRGSAELEIGLTLQDGDGSFAFSLAYDDPEDPEDRRKLGTEPIIIDTDELALLVDNDDAYGKALSEMLFSANLIRGFYENAARFAGTRDVPLHLRLLLDPGADMRFHAVRWESLRDPSDGTPIATKRNILFSRFLSSNDFRTFAQPPKHDLRALVVIASPSDLRTFAPVDVETERKLAHVALDGIRVTELPQDGPPTLDEIADCVDEGIDLLYLVCHGALKDGEPRLYLEKEGDGTTDVVDGSTLVERFAGLQRRPVLVVLCSCQSAGPGDASAASGDSARIALGPRLAASGVPAVLAMQGNISMETAERFFPKFFQALAVDGVVDRAVAVARATVRKRHDWWVPVLFSRLKRGRTWYLPGFTKDSDYAWQTLTNQITNGKCTPFLGPGLSAGILGSRREIARRWADRWQMPIVEANQGDLAKVAQYLRVRTARLQPSDELISYLITEFHDRYGERLPPRLVGSNDPVALACWIGARQREADPNDPHAVMAALGAPIYITTSWTPLLEEALIASGREPTVRFFDWNHVRGREEEKEFPIPSPEKPLVYHLFGHIDDAASLVLAEDDYFEWLKAWIAERDDLPKGIRTAFTRQSMLFLGYRLDDLDFRVLFQGINSFGGSNQMNNYLHVGVQLDPESTLIETEAAQEYLEMYFGESVNIFWGDTDEFLAELQQRRGGP